MTIDALPDYRERIDVRSPAEFAIDHIPGAQSQPVLDDDERARIGTLHAQRFGVRRAPGRRRRRRPQHRGDARRRVPRQAARLGAARLLLARRTAQPVAHARVERGRLARRPARGRLSRVPAQRGEPARDVAVALRLSRRLRAHGLRQEPPDRRARRRRRAGARSRAHCATSRIAARRPPRRSAAHAEGVRERARRSAAAIRSGASRLRRIGEQAHRHAAGPRVASRRRCARRRASGSSFRARSASSSSSANTRTSSPIRRRWPRGSSVSFRCTERRPSSSGPPRRTPASGIA